MTLLWGEVNTQVVRLLFGETIFLFSWVIAFDEVGWPGFIEATIFIVILLVALIYLWRIGALELKHRHLPFKDKNPNHQHTKKGSS